MINTKHIAGALILGTTVLSSAAFAASNELLLPQIVGGVDAEDGPYRWTTSLQSTSGSHYCGGSLIADNWIVTAAHCVNGTSNPSSIRVVVGRNNLSTSQGSAFTVNQVIVHPGYNTSTLDNDIALLRFTGTAPASIDRVPLADSSVMSSSGQPDDMARVLGWGATSEGGSGTNQLQRVDVPIVSNATCNSNYNGDITNNMICAGYTNGGKDSCQGDSGGPFVVSHNGEYHLAGIVSWGHGCARPGKPGVYARVENYVSWVNGHIGGTDPTDPTELQNGVPVNSITGGQGSETSYTLEVPANASDLSFSISGGTGDADLYVNVNAPATVDDYICRPYIGGNNETCDISNAQATTYHVMIRGYTSYTNVSLVGSYTTGSDGKVELHETNLSAGRGGWEHFSLNVPSGLGKLTVVISGGSGDADLYVREGAQPTTNSWDCRPYVDGNSETCEFNNPNGGTWHFGVRGYRSFSGVSLDAVAE